MTRRSPREVMPERVAGALPDTPYWFVIGGQAVRCFTPYRPSRDVDLGVENAKDIAALLRQLRKQGRVEVIERAEDTVHLSFEGIDVSIFALRELLPHTEDRALTVTGLLATKLHAIIDRGTRRDFFDLYVLLQQRRLGLLEALRALSQVYPGTVNEGLILRALVFFDDADQEAPLPGEGAEDWQRVKDFFQSRVGTLILPPERPLSIQSQLVDVRGARPAGGTKRKPRRAR